MSVGKRLKEERKRLHMTQDELGTACGVSKWAQFNFEKDENMPGGAYLLAAMSRGVNVMYVLTGQGAQLDPTEAALVAAFREAAPEARSLVLATLGLVSSSGPGHAPMVAIHGGEVGQVNTIAGNMQQTNTFSVGGKKKRS